MAVPGGDERTVRVPERNDAAVDACAGEFVNGGDRIELRRVEDRIALALEDVDFPELGDTQARADESSSAGVWRTESRCRDFTSNQRIQVVIRRFPVVDGQRDDSRVFADEQPFPVGVEFVRKGVDDRAREREGDAAAGEVLLGKREELRGIGDDLGTEGR